MVSIRMIPWGYFSGYITVECYSWEVKEGILQWGYYRGGNYSRECYCGDILVGILQLKATVGRLKGGYYSGDITVGILQWGCYCGDTTVGMLQ